MISQMLTVSKSQQLFIHQIESCFVYQKQSLKNWFGSPSMQPSNGRYPIGGFFCKLNDMKIISFSLYGSSELYLCGALENARLANELFPNWQAVFYVGDSVPRDTKAELIKLGATLIEIHDQENSSAMFWRYQALRITGVEKVIFRDADSRLTGREKTAVSEWENSGVSLHIIRDHPFHTIPMLGGMWGLKGVKSLQSAAAIFHNSSISFGTEYGDDQVFLANYVYRQFKGDILAHDAFYRFPGEKTLKLPGRIEGEFIGERISCFGEPDFELRGIAQKAETNPIKASYGKVRAYLDRAKFLYSIK
jgi:hypothetical protein